MKSLVRRAGLDGTVHVESAGTADYHTGELPDVRARAAAKEQGPVISDESGRVDSEFIDTALKNLGQQLPLQRHREFVGEA